MSYFRDLMMAQGGEAVPEWIVSLCDKYGLDKSIVYNTYKELGDEMQTKVSAFTNGTSYLKTDRKCRWSTGVVPTSTHKSEFVVNPSSTSYWSILYGIWGTWSIGMSGSTSMIYYGTSQQVNMNRGSLKCKFIFTLARVQMYLWASNSWVSKTDQSLNSTSPTTGIVIEDNGTGTTSQWFYVRMYDGSSTTHLYIPYADNQFLDLATGELKTRTGTGTATYYAS